MEVCQCSGSGFVMRDGKRVPCICKILKIYERYLGVFKKFGPPHPNVVNFVNSCLLSHSNREKQLTMEKQNKYKETFIEGKLMEVEPVKLRRHWFMIDGLGKDPVHTSSGMGHPKDWYMQFFFQYLVRTKEYTNYRMFDLVTLQNIYYGYGDDVEFASADIQGVGSGFYGYTSDVFLLHFKNILPGKEALNILRHFLDTYREKNIIIYADSTFRQLPTIRKWSEDQSRYVQAILAGEKSLQDMLTSEYGDTFVDLMSKDPNKWLKKR